MKNLSLKIAGCFKKYPELLSIPIAILVWVISCKVLRWIDPQSGVFDAGVFQVPLFAIIQLFVFVSIAWLLLRTVFGTVADYLKNHLKIEFPNLTKWQRIKIAYGIFFGLLFSLILLSHTLIASR